MLVPKAKKENSIVVKLRIGENLKSAFNKSNPIFTFHATMMM